MPYLRAERSRLYPEGIYPEYAVREPNIAHVLLIGYCHCQCHTAPRGFRMVFRQLFSTGGSARRGSAHSVSVLRGSPHSQISNAKRRTRGRRGGAFTANEHRGVRRLSGGEPDTHEIDTRDNAKGRAPRYEPKRLVLWSTRDQDCLCVVSLTHSLTVASSHVSAPPGDAPA
mgnify:CR=1 FL=1